MTFAQKRQIIVEMKIAESRAWLESEQAKYAAEVAEYNDQDGSFLNDDYCDHLDNENHD